jgi:hypothetical protein
MELTADINIIPGLSGLNLNIFHAIDMHMIDNAKHTIFKWIQKEHRGNHGFLNINYNAMFLCIHLNIFFSDVRGFFLRIFNIFNW